MSDIELHHEIEKDDNPHIDSLYENYFLDYASYVILDRAVPYYEDGLKPVQRRILHSFWEKNDGRYHKIANIIGHTMQYHPHGDAAIGEAIVNLGQKNLLIDTQGNWGNPVTGDRAAASRYIEGRLTPFALEVVFNAETTHWSPSYDGRSKEPNSLPIKFPLVLAQGVKGIAVGLTTEILPHNPAELLKASISYLKNRKFSLYPDFQGGGLIDASTYKDGAKGGKLKVRAKIEKIDNKSIKVTEVPYGVTTSSLIDSIVSANDKNKIKIKKIEDNTARDVEVLIQLPPSTDVDKTIEALYTFTDCEVSISPNCCVIVDNTPLFLSVSELLKKSTDQSVELLKWELENQINALNMKWHMTSLEKIFIEERIYRKIENAESREDMIDIVQKGLKPFLPKLRKDVTVEEVVKLTEIPIRRISRFDAKKTDELLKELNKKLREAKANLKNLTEYAIDYFNYLLKKYGGDWARKTEITEFQTLSAKDVAVASQRLYVDRKGGFVGTGLKKEEYLFDCSPYNELIVFKRDCTYMVTKVGDKNYVGKDVIHVEIFEKGDERRIYNVIYEDGVDKKTYIKRFNVTGVTRNKDYHLGKDAEKSRVLYFSSNPNGEAELVEIVLKPRPKIKLNFKLDFAETLIKARGVKGNLVTKYPIKKINKLKEGKSTLGALSLYYDKVANSISSNEGGALIGEFGTDDLVLVFRSTGDVGIMAVEDQILPGLDFLWAAKWNEEKLYTIVYVDDGTYYLKRFKMEELTSGKTMGLINMGEKSEILAVTDQDEPNFYVEFQAAGSRKILNENLVVDDSFKITTSKALGNKLPYKKIKTISVVDEAE